MDGVRSCGNAKTGSGAGAGAGAVARVLRKMVGAIAPGS